jgi:tellurite resistance protein
VSKKQPLQKSELEKLAQQIATELKGKDQNALFRAAVEAGHLAALADGDADAAEQGAIVKAIEVLSSGAVIEWEVEALIAESAERIAAEGAVERSAAVGAALKGLKQVDAGLLIASLVAFATGGLDKREAGVLERIGVAAGLGKPEITAIVKRARAAL